MRNTFTNPFSRALALFQGGFYVITGIWPILHMRSFEAVTGPKTDKWLVKTVGGMITALGGVLFATGLKKGPSDDLVAAAVASASVLTAVDVVYTMRGRIRRVYLLDAVAETALIAAWLFAAKKR
jgi:hypothetical protein